MVRTRYACAPRLEISMIKTQPYGVHIWLDDPGMVKKGQTPVAGASHDAIFHLLGTGLGE